MYYCPRAYAQTDYDDDDRYDNDDVYVHDDYDDDAVNDADHDGQLRWQSRLG